MNTKSAIRQLDKLVRSKVPIIYIVTREERRVVECIAHYANLPVNSLSGSTILDRRQTWRWTMTRGLVPLVVDPDTGLVHEAPAESPIAQTFDPNTADANVAMAQIGYHAQGSGDAYGTIDGKRANASLFVMLDLHRHIGAPQDGGSANPIFQRSLRDLYGQLLQTHTAVIIVTPRHIDLGDIANEVAVMDWPLPDQDELQVLVQETAARLPDHLNTDLNGGTAAIASALAGLTLEESESALLGAAYETAGLVPDQVIPHIIESKREAVSQAAGLEYIDHTETLNSVGGLDLLKQAVANLDRLMVPQALEDGVEPIDGILLVGVPGCGKSLMAKAIAGGTKPCIRQNVGEQFTSLLGGTEANMRAAFSILQVIGPCVWWIDEIEKLFGGSGQGETDGGTGRRVLGMLLTFMEERKDRAPFVLPVVTANDVTAIPPELINRFELIFFVDLPDLAACRDILTIHLDKRNLHLNDTRVRLEDLASRAHAKRLNGREIERCVKSARRRNYTSGDNLGLALLTAINNLVGIADNQPERIDAIRSWGRRHALPASTRQEIAAVSPSEATLLL